MKTSKSKIFIMLIAGFFIIYGVVRSSGMYCNMEEFFSDKQGEEDDACIAKLIKRADDGNGFAESRLRYPSRAYIKRVCEKGVENLGERERYYFERYQSCEPWGFKTPKLQDGEANTTSGDANATDSEGNLTRESMDTIHNATGVIKRDINSTGGSNAWQ
ncbi:hypothetical protein [uncultured Campylobacter sp.]|uniref:hypothetical protein n=1 Tax=uncultured Campylobacter sp. TaxID=218934 RepID=UPI00261AFA54|nr:hypothetical protein [uncultured Campylobacter sp.]